MRTEGTESDTKLESVKVRTYEGSEKQIYLSPTEKLIFEIITDFRFTVKDKIKLICHYQSLLDFDLFNHFWDVALFMEQLKRKMRAQ